MHRKQKDSSKSYRILKFQIRDLASVPLHSSLNAAELGIIIMFNLASVPLHSSLNDDLFLLNL